jgi:hypothetical protein
MITGMMYSYAFENDKKKAYDVKAEVITAARYYEKKNGIYPDTCFLNIEAECDAVVEDGERKINISKYKWILDKCLMIGTEKEHEFKPSEFSA